MLFGEILMKGLKKYESNKWSYGEDLCENTWIIGKILCPLSLLSNSAKLHYAKVAYNMLVTITWRVLGYSE